MSDYGIRSIALHKEKRGKLTVTPSVRVENADDLSLVYTPGVGDVSSAIAEGTIAAKDVVASKNMVAVVTDGSAVLGLGNIGAEASLPVMEGKAVLFKEMAGIDAFPIALDTQNVNEIVETVARIAPTFGAVNLEDISAPRCFEVERRLNDKLNIPVFHDDQHGTAIVVLAGLFNALKLTGKRKEDVKIVVSGAGAAGHATIKLLIAAGFKHLTALDKDGVLNSARTCLREDKQYLCDTVTTMCGEGDTSRCELTVLDEAIVGADVFIGVSAPGVLTQEMVRTMAGDPIIFALANPVPEIMPAEATAAGAAVIATGRSDFPNQVNNALVFPGIFKGVLASGVNEITTEMKLKAAEALARLIPEPTPERIIPSIFDEGVVDVVANAVSN